jgi:hypothetical protein
MLHYHTNETIKGSRTGCSDLNGAVVPMTETSQATTCRNAQQLLPCSSVRDSAEMLDITGWHVVHVWEHETHEDAIKKIACAIRDSARMLELVAFVFEAMAADLMLIALKPHFANDVNLH